MNNKFIDSSKNNNTTYGVILFDSSCLMCNHMVQFLLRYNKKENLLFTSIDSVKAKELKIKYQIDPAYSDSMIFIYRNKVYMKSIGFFHILKQLRFPFNLFYYLSYVTVKPIGDWVYDKIAQNRNLFFKKQDSCFIFPPEHMLRFI